MRKKIKAKIKINGDSDLSGFQKYMIEEELSIHTRENYHYTMKIFFQRYEKMNKKNALDFKQYLMTFCKPKTVNARISGIEKYCKYKGIHLELKRVPEQKRNHVENVINESQYQHLMQCLRHDGNIRWYYNFLLLARTGARISEALRITKADVERGFVDMPTKHKFRRIYIPKSLQQELSDYLKNFNENEPVLKNKLNNPLTSRGVSGYMKKCAKKYGIPEKVMHPHAFRHFFAIEFLKHNNNISLLADILGHSGVNTTMIYTRMSGEEQKQQIDKAVNW